MAETVRVDVRVHHRVLREMARSEDTYDLVRRGTEAVAAEMRRGAPVRTGAGRGSIRARVEMGADGWIGAASWDEAHYYMGIQNSRRRFAETALQRVRYV